MPPPYPDELVNLLCEDIASNKGQVKLTEIWQIAANYIEIKDEKIKEYVFLSLIANKDIALYENGKSLKTSFSDLIGKEDYVSVHITEDKLWTVLTGYTKKESNLGNAAFELLLEIAKARDRGINTKDLAIATKQDPRSITGRVKKLEGLICSVQMIYKGHVVKLLKLQKYAKMENVVKPYVNIREYLPKIVEIVKNSKNGVRQIIDLKRELKLDTDKRLSKSFIAAINWLTEKGHLKKVLVVSPTNVAVKIRCVKYLRDYLIEEKASSDFEFETDSDNEECLDYEKTAGGDVDAYEGLDSFNATNLLQEENLILEEKNDVQRSKFLLNRFYPIQNQTYGFANQSGLNGVSTMQLIRTVTGADYRRAFTKLTELYVKNAGKQGQTSQKYEIVRIYDFEGKKKFYRFFTGDNFCTLTGSTQSTGHNSNRGSPQDEALSTLDKSSFVPLSSTLRFIRRDGKDIFFWNGELKVPPSSNAPVLGRKRKHEDASRDRIETPLKKHPKATIGTSTNQNQNLKSSSKSNTHKKYSAGKGEIINVGGFSANSLRSLWRQRAILEVMKKSGGVTYLREQFFEDVSRFMGSSTMLDKKTVRGDVALMIETKKLHDQLETHTQKRLIYLPGLEKSVIDDYMLKEKDNKKTQFGDIIHTTDIYFFDQTEKDKFHRGKKSAERIRQFQSQSRAQAGIEPSGNRSIKRTRKENKTPKKRKNVPSSNAVEPSAADDGSGEPCPKLVFHMGNKEGLKSLVMAVVISKSIKNEIEWEQITKLFPNNSLENLKKQWTVRRIKMGHHGWRAYIDKWRKILVSAIKNEIISLEDAERLNLPQLIALWKDAEETKTRAKISLYRDFSENRRQYTFVKESEYSTKVGLSMSSMVQRETSLLKKVYTYDYPTVFLEESNKEDSIRMFIRSLLFERNTIIKDDLQQLSDISKETLDKILMDMAREKQIRFSGTRLETTGLTQDVLKSKGAHEPFEESAKYVKKLQEMRDAKNAIIVSEEISDTASWSLIDLITTRKVSLFPLAVATDHQPLSYTTRRFGIRALTPPLVIIPSKRKLSQNLPYVPVPIHEPSSRLWIDSMGTIRQTIWRDLVCMIIKEVLFSPGIDQTMLLENCRPIVTKIELEEICNWLIARELLINTELGGYLVTHKWYRAME